MSKIVDADRQDETRKLIVRQDEARKLIERLVKISPDPGTVLRARRLLTRIKLPMSVVVDRIPGDSIIQKAAKLSVSRQTLYYWLDGITRPNRKQAKLIAALTGFGVDEIRGRDGAG